MRFHLPDPETIEISRLNLLVAEFLRQAPFEAEPGKHEGARDRLFSSPMHPHHADPEFLEDWHDLVRPDLETLFRGATETVARDLVSLREERPPSTEEEGPALEEREPSPTYAIRIPVAHLEAWLSCLNQARLVISEKFSFGEEDMNSPLGAPPSGKRDFALYQVHFYALLQELFLDIINAGEGDAAEDDGFDSDDFLEEEGENEG
jgi:hypothetical protein